jgi:putative phage-type endonuclease
MALSAKQEAAHYSGIGSSRIAAILGIDPYKTPFQAWRELVDPSAREDLSEDDDVQAGNIFERAICEGAGYKLREKVVFPPEDETFTHPKYPWAIAHPDALLPSRAAVVEAKMRNWRLKHRYGEEGTDQAQDQEIAQCIWIMGVMREAKPMSGQEAYLAVQLDKKLPLIFPIQFDAEFFGIMLEKAREFRDRYVLPKLPPPPSNTRDAAILYPRAQQGKTIEIDSAMLHKLLRLREMREHCSLLDTQADRLADEITPAFGAAQIMAYNGQAVATWNSQDNHRIDVGRLRAEMPHVAKQYETVSCSRTLRFKTHALRAVSEAV